MSRTTVFLYEGNEYTDTKSLYINEIIVPALTELSGVSTNWLRRVLFKDKSSILLKCVFGIDNPQIDIVLEEVRYLLGGELSIRYANMIVFEYSHFIIPGLLLASGAPDDKNHVLMLSEGFKCFISLMEPEQEIEKGITYGNRHEYSGDFNTEKYDVTYCRYSIVDRKVASDEKALMISDLILSNITRKIPTVLHCFGGKGRAGTISSIVLGRLYHMKSQKCLNIINTLFENRENKGTKCKQMPQTKCQFEQVKRIVDDKSKWCALY